MYVVFADNIDGWRTDEEGRPSYGYALLVLAGIGIFCGCVGKSAQFPLHTWLPDAMEGPTPVSALVHSATMVAAGVFLVARFYPLFAPEALLVIAVVGCITLFMAATIAITATDIKRVLASPYVAFWLGAKDASIYSALKTMARQGLARVIDSDRATRYEITPLGVAEFERCRGAAWQAQDERLFETALAVSGDLSSEEKRQALARRREQLELASDRLQGLKAGAMSQLLVRREEALLAAELQWLGREIEEEFR